MIGRAKAVDWLPKARSDKRGAVWRVFGSDAMTHQLRLVAGRAGLEPSQTEQFDVIASAGQSKCRRDQLSFCSTAYKILDHHQHAAGFRLVARASRFCDPRENGWQWARPAQNTTPAAALEDVASDLPGQQHSVSPK